MCVQEEFCGDCWQWHNPEHVLVLERVCKRKLRPGEEASQEFQFIRLVRATSLDKTRLPHALQQVSGPKRGAGGGEDQFEVQWYVRVSNASNAAQQTSR